MCELCISRALNQGWVREGSEPPVGEQSAASDRRRSLLSRLLGRRERAFFSAAEDPPEELPAASESLPAPDGDSLPAGSQAAVQAREPRHVRAVPTSAEQRIAVAAELFNRSEHRHTVAGIGRSLGMPTVAIRPVDGSPSLVNVVASWELCWYRYEVDLADDTPNVRVSAQGYELDELADEQRLANAVSDEHGCLAVTGED